VEALLERFRAAHTQVLGVSVDSIHCHANWGRDLGGVSFPLLADFEPKGAVAREYGVYLDGAGITDRATVWVDSAGVVRHASSVGPAGQRDIAELADLAEQLDAASDAACEPLPEGAGVAGAVLYVRDKCGSSRAVRVALDNLHIADTVEVRNVSRDAAALQSLRDVSGAETAPCLVLGGEAVRESAAIISLLAQRTCPVGRAG